MGLRAKSKKKVNPKAIQQSYLSKIEGELKDDGVVLFEPENGTLDINEEYLMLPPEITEVPSKYLGELLNAFTQQKMYMRTLVGRMEIFVEEARRAYYHASAPFYRELPDRMSETAKERNVVSEPTVRPHYEEFMDLTKKLNILKMQIANIEDSIFLISREVTRRTGDFTDENRSHNVSNQRKVARV